MKRALLGLGLCLTAAGIWAAPDYQQQASELLIVSNRTGNAEIFLAGADGRNAKNLTNNKSDNSYSAWSPNGRQIAFASDRDGAPNIYVMDADGGNVKQLTKGKEGSRIPSWTPDGKKIVFCRFVAGGSGIFIMDGDGSNAQQIGKDDGWDPAVSPDGKQILFTSRRKGDGFRVYVMDLDGRNTRELTTNANPIGYVYPSWSPDGRKIAFTDSTGGGLEIFVVDADGKNNKQLTKLGGMSTYSAWSPDGKTITFYSTSDGESGSILTMSAAGENVRELLADEKIVEGGRVAWRPK